MAMIRSLKTTCRSWKAALCLAAMGLVLVGPTAGALALTMNLSETMAAKKLELTVGKSVILKSTEPFTRVTIADPEIADFVLLSPPKRGGERGPTEIYVTGKAAGLTNMTLWQHGRVAEVYDLEVSYDVSRLKQKLHEILPQEKGIRVTATHDSITLSGPISSSGNITQALALAASYAPENKINNMLQVAGVQQVMLEVRVAEMARSLAKQLGVNLNYARGGDFGITTLGGLTQVVNPQDAMLAAGPVGLLVSPAINSLFRFHSGSASWTGFIDALKEDGLAKVLAEPTLIAQSGQTASFLAGGEFPVPVPQGLGTVAIEYKPFGVGLAFTPTVLSDKINIKVAPEVSELDFSTAVRFSGFVVPGLTTRRASTTVELGDGQSFAIAGLLRDSARETISKYPLIGDIPILGSLFRSKSFQKNETELIIIVTPHLVKPLNMAEQTLPTDYYVEPDDAEFYLWGVMGKSHEGAAYDGEFGHAYK
jgi:pilus assembly protein CpaC